MIKINYLNNEYEVKKGITIEEFITNNNIDINEDVLCATVNNVLYELTYKLNRDCVINFIYLNQSLGQKIYKTSLSFLFIKAVYDVLDKANVSLCHTLSRGQYCEIDNHEDISEEQIAKIKERMIELCNLNIPFKGRTLSREEAIDLFKKIKKYDHVSLLKTMYKETVNIYSLDGYVTYFNNYLVPSTGYIKNFDVVKENKGVVLLCPSKKDSSILEKHTPQPKLQSAFAETKKWANIMEVDYVAELNNKVIDGTYSELIRTIEALHEKKIADMAQDIYDKKKRVILIAGPSSSGKTTTSKRLETQLKVLGLKPISISLDDYFVNRVDTPLDEFGEKDYESIYAIDLKQFNIDLQKLLNAEEATSSCNKCNKI